LGINATTFTNGQCPAYSTALAEFVGAACGGSGGTYTGGQNISIASNTISTVNSPTFSGTITSTQTGDNFLAENSGRTMIAAEAGAVVAPTTDCRTATGLYVGFCQIATDSAMHFNVTYSGVEHDCFFTWEASNAGPFDVSCPFDFTASAPVVNALTANEGVCSGSGKALVSCIQGQVACALASATTCTATATVTSGPQCTATYDHASTVTLSALAPLTIGQSGTSLLMYARTSTAQTGTVYVDYRC
jgi:hypothetical protein